MIFLCIRSITFCYFTILDHLFRTVAVSRFGMARSAERWITLDLSFIVSTFWLKMYLLKSSVEVQYTAYHLIIPKIDPTAICASNSVSIVFLTNLKNSIRRQLFVCLLLLTIYKSSIIVSPILLISLYARQCEVFPGKECLASDFFITYFMIIFFGYSCAW